jgi:transcriptional regulator with XRE-family HTH domain
MKSINDIRRDNLREIIDKDFDGTQTRLAEALKLQPNLVSRWLHGTKNIGDAVARKIETAARKPKYWLDTDHVLSMAAGAEDDGTETEIGMIAAGNLVRWMDGNRELSSQQKVADKSGVSQATINRLLRNEASLTLNSVAAIAKAFGRRPYELLIPPKDVSIINYDHSRYAELPLSEKAKIESFIDFVFMQNHTAA